MLTSKIFQDIWAADTQRFTVATRNAAGGWDKDEADIYLDEQRRSGGSRNRDLAANPLFQRVRREKLEEPQYRAFVALLDNYLVNYRAPEIIDAAEQEEIVAFLDAVFETECMEVARRYVIEELRVPLTEERFRRAVEEMWFSIYVNHYRGRSTSYCSGFEHVFVGEGRYDARGGATAQKGEISGYHSWIKFYLDEYAGRVNYLGYKYDLGGDGPDMPHVVTLQMLWNHLDVGGGLRAQLFKRKGGFFVGTSPACELALGTVAFYQSVAEIVQNDRIPVELDGGNFNLVIYRNVEDNGRRGRYVRSFYPEFLGTGGRRPRSRRAANGVQNSTVLVPISPDRANSGSIKIVGAMVDPPGTDEEGEWVELRNQTDAPIELTDWEVRDRLGRPLELSGVIGAQQSRRFANPRRRNGMALSNKGGVITVHSGAELVAAVSYASVAEGQETRFA